MRAALSCAWLTRRLPAPAPCCVRAQDEQLRCAACTCLWELSSQWRTVRWSLVEARVVPALLRLMSDARQLGSRAGEAACGDGSESDSGSGGCCVGDERETEEHADAGDAAVATLANLLQGSPPAKQVRACGRCACHPLTLASPLSPGRRRWWRLAAWRRWLRRWRPRRPGGARSRRKRCSISSAARRRIPPG